MGGRGWVVEEEVERRKIMIGQAWVRHGSAEVWADSSPEPPAVGKDSMSCCACLHIL